MCGFVAVINSNQNKDNLILDFNNLKKINLHRGPDEIKSLHNKNFSLLFRRLSIIDLNKRSSQPFSSEDGRINLVFNGEIYNYLEIKKELIRKKFKFKTSSDTEVVLKSYQCWGASFVKKLRGMFAIVILDDVNKKYFCFRDRLGQKPLYYSKYQDGLVISSEIKDIIFFKKKATKENKKIVKKYLIRGWCDDTNETFFNGISAFPAGSIGIIKESTIKISPYWRLEVNNSKEFNKEEFNEIFTENLKIHLRSDVPIAFTLSGGLDSSSLVKKSLEYNFSKNKAFSLNSVNKNENDEKNFIDEFINVNSLRHSYLNLEKKKDNNILEKVIFFQDEPIGSTSFLNQFLLREKINSEGFKVLMVGEGGDEVLGGYNRMFIPYLYNIFIKNKKEIPAIVKKNISLNLGKNFSNIEKQIYNYKLSIDKDNDIEDDSSLIFLNLESKRIPKDLRFYNPTIPSKKNSFKLFLLNHIFKRDLPHILRQEDRVSMSQSIENRTPFVDHKLLEYVFSRDEKFFMLNGQSKFMLRSIMKNKLPNSFFNKKKVGRPGDASFLVFKVYFEKFLDYLSSNDSKNCYFDSHFLKESIEKDKKNKQYKNSNFYFRVLNYFVWKKNISNLISLS